MDTSYDYGTPTNTATPWGLYVFLGVVVVLLVVAAVLLLRRRTQQQRQELDKKALKIILPKPAVASEERRDPKEIIGVMEPVFAALHHYFEHNVWKRFWHGQPTFTFEIVANNSEIFFYVFVPVAYLQQIEHQIHAQYPTAHIEIAHDYDVFVDQEGGSAIGALKLNRQFIFPIRTYKTLESDPLSALTSTLSKIGEGKAAIQILIQPANQIWQKSTEEALQNVQQGKSLRSMGGAARAFNVAQEVGKSAMGNVDEKVTNEAQNVYKGNVRLTALQEQQTKLLADKGSKIGFKVQIRCVAKAATKSQADAQVQTMLSGFAQFQSPESNGFRVVGLDRRELIVNYILRTVTTAQPFMILNTEELASLFHFPNKEIDTPNIHWLGARRFHPPTNLPKSGVSLGYSDFRGSELPVYYQYSDRTRHLYMIGKTGVGKTNLFQNMIIQDIRNGHGVCYIDPNGDAIEWILRHVPKERAEDVILFDPADTARPLAMNLLEYDPAVTQEKDMVINEMISIFDKLYDLKATGGPMFEQYMRNAMRLIMDDPESGSTLMEIPKVMADPVYRKMKLAKSRDEQVRHFWTQEAEKAGGEAALANVVPYVTSKLTQFTSNDLMRPIIGQQKSAFNFREVMDSKKILLVSLPKGLLGEMSAQLLGMIISGKLQIAAFSRQNVGETEREPFYMYVDEFQNFTSHTFAIILSEARKYGLSLNITNQYIEQLDDDTRSAVFGNVGTIITWRVGPTDAEFLQKELDPLTIDDLVNTEKYNYYIRLLIDGTPSRPFNVTAYPPDPHENTKVGEAIRQLSRLKYGKDRELIEAEIRLRSKNML